MVNNLDKETSLPYSIEAEKAVLGCIMRKNDTWDLVAGLVIEDDFYQKEHKLIYRNTYMYSMTNNDILDTTVHNNIIFSLNNTT